jgi:mono/diheme cytochrome c family protein
MRRHPLALAALVALLAAGCDRAETDAEAGRRLAAERCGACHAVDRDDASPMAEAPPFRTLGQRYPLDNLEEALAEGIFAGHPEMPDDPWAPDDIARLLAWLETIQTP